MPEFYISKAGSTVSLPTLRNMTTEEVIELLNKNQAYKIYKSKEFKELRKDVMNEFHNECARCKSKGKITRAQTVHHVQYVKKHPELAFSKYYTDKHGNRKRNLIPLCNDCHNAVHDRFGYEKKEKPLTEERW